jgi:outer membrane murein-binding lipoprotein Lpp
MEKNLLAIIVPVAIASLSMAGCASPTSSNPAADNASQAASLTATTANTAMKATASASATYQQHLPTPSATPTTAPVPTVVSWQVIPVGSSINTTSGISRGIVAQEKYICLNGLTANVSIAGAPTRNNHAAVM